MSLVSSLLQMALLALLLVGCSSQSKSYNSSSQNTELSATKENTIPELKPIDISDVKLPTAYIISPESYPYFLYVFEKTGAFEDVKKGYMDDGLEIRVQREVDIANKGTAITSLFVSAATLFVVPAYTNVTDIYRFSVSYKGNHLKDYDYKQSRAHYTSLFTNPDITEHDVMLKVDEYIVRKFVRELKDSNILY